MSIHCVTSKINWEPLICMSCFIVIPNTCIHWEKSQVDSWVLFTFSLSVFLSLCVSLYLSVYLSPNCIVKLLCITCISSEAEQMPGNTPLILNFDHLNPLWGFFPSTYTPKYFLRASCWIPCFSHAQDSTWGASIIFPISPSFIFWWLSDLCFIPGF